MEFKVDIRFIILSALAHLVIFTLLTWPARSGVETQPERVEITLQDNHQNQKIVVPKLKKHEDKEDDNNQAHFMSDQVQRFQKQTVAQNLGIPENKQQQAQQKPQEQERTPGPSYLAMPQQQANEARQSSINFELPNVAKGDLTFLNSDFSTYAAFYNRITPMIMYRWGNNISDVALFPYMRETLMSKSRWTTRVMLTLDRQGHYVDTTIENSSGSVEMDQAIVGAFKSATPFLNPPSGMVENDGKVHIEGEFTVYTQRPRLAY